ncbi:hypothetical protein HDV00_005105 [Rhizophlyctis rosea]|nr:hypothetical protein HDV00_005105 [Rhizophlyctis rosea]
MASIFSRPGRLIQRSGGLLGTGSGSRWRAATLQSVRTQATAIDTPSTTPAAPALPPHNPVSDPILRIRLEEHYYNTLLEDIMVLSYDHNSPNASLDALAENPEWNLSYDSEYLQTLFTSRLDRLPTLPQTDITTSLLTRQNAVATELIQPRRFSRKAFNPIDYVNVKPEVRNARIPLPPPPPFTPLPSKLPIPASVVLRIWTEKAIQNKYAQTDLPTHSNLSNLIPFITRSVLLPAIMSLQSITGVRADPLFATESIAQKRIREGMPMGARVEITGPKMFEFLDKLAQCVLPRIREWEGVNPVGDGRGSISFTLPDTAMGYFPDIEPHFDSFPRLFDTEVIIKTTGRDDWETALCLSGFQIPFLEERVVDVEEVQEGDPNDPWAALRDVKSREARKELAAKIMAESYGEKGKRK